MTYTKLFVPVLEFLITEALINFVDVDQLASVIFVHKATTNTSQNLNVIQASTLCEKEGFHNSGFLGLVKNDMNAQFI